MKELLLSFMKIRQLKLKLQALIVIQSHAPPPYTHTQPHAPHIPMHTAPPPPIPTHSPMHPPTPTYNTQALTVWPP